MKSFLSTFILVILIFIGLLAQWRMRIECEARGGQLLFITCVNAV